MDELKLIIAKNIALLRKDNNITQLELAEKLNYSDKAISKWERGESVPDIAVLKSIADLFGVTVDYLLEEEHKISAIKKFADKRILHNRGFITGMCIVLVWLLASVAFVTLDVFTKGGVFEFIPFICAAPASVIVWLVFNSIWFNQRRNFFIISLLVWVVLASAFLTLLIYDYCVWQMFILGVPAQIIIGMWSGIRVKRK